MLFELRTSVPDVSPAWTEARDEFLAGRSRRAWELATALRGQAAVQTANDLLLNIEIARACSAHRLSLALARPALARFPSDPLVRLYYARMLLTRGRHLPGIDFLQACESTLGQSHRALWGTALANVYGNAGFEASCRRWLQAVQHEPGIDSPLALYTQSCASEGMQQWDDAIAFARRCVAAAPDWSRARAHLAHCLLARGRVDESAAEIAEAQRRGHQEALVDVTAAMLALSRGHFAEARPRLEKVLADWPQADYVRWVRRTLCILLVELGELAAAREVAAGQEAKFALPPIPEAAAGSHQFLPLPLLAQNKNQCVPTAVAMAAYPQERRFDPDVLFREMHGREGTSLWRMKRWVEQNGLRLVPVRLEKEAIRGLVDRRVPLIGVLEGTFNSHVDVICGYHDDLATLYIRDPGDWAPQAWPWEIALARYELHQGLLAVIAEEAEETIAFAHEWRSGDCAALVALSQAVAQGELAEAEAAYAQIADDSPAAFLRDTYSVNVVISPVKFNERMRLVTENEQANSVARFRAILALGTSEGRAALEKLLQADQSQRYGAGVRRYLALLQLMSEGAWQPARAVIDRLLLSGGSIAYFWELKSDILAETGEHDASREALERAIELEPLRVSLREKALRRDATKLTFGQYLQEFEALLAEDPDDKRLLWGRASALQDGPDGKLYEQAALEAQRWFPRHPGGHFALIHWYRLQNRADLASAAEERARKLLPDLFPEPAEEPIRAELADDAVVAELADEPAPAPVLPEDKGELLGLIWALADQRRPAALARAIELEQGGALDWAERARLLACRLLFPPPGQAAEPAELLTDQPPGAAHWFAGALCDALTDYDPPLRLALAVNDWLERATPNFRDYPDLWFQRVLLLEHGKRMEAALVELRQLLDRYPASSSALYRLGVVNYRQEDYAEARQHFEKALEVNPGLMGAMQMLRSVHEVLGNRAEYARCSQLLLRKCPYSAAYLRDVILAVTELESPQRAEELLAQHAADFLPERIAVERAQLLIAQHRFAEAQGVLQPLALRGDEDEELYEDWLRARLEIAEQLENRAEVLAICEAGLRRWPNSTRLQELQAEYVADSDPERSRALLQTVLCEGEPRAYTAFQFLNLAKFQPPWQTAVALVQSAPAARRQDLAELFSEAMGHSTFVRWNTPYLEWAEREFPDSDSIRHRLALHYNICGQVEQAVLVARELHRRQPDHPESVRILGRCLIEHDAREAVEHLERASELNRSADLLFDLARAYQCAGLPDRSLAIHWELLEQNPYMSASWTNLYLNGADRERLWPYVERSLERGYGFDDEYYLVAVVMIALDLARVLPVAWFPLAKRRLEILQTLPGFRDERQRLTDALVAWCVRRPKDDPAYRGVERGWLAWFRARFRWPWLKWIPPRA